MKPQDLKPPFPKDQKKNVIHDRVWYLFTDDEFSFPGWEHPHLYGNTNPVCIEYCSGNGAWITAQALGSSSYQLVSNRKKVHART